MALERVTYYKERLVVLAIASLLFFLYFLVYWVAVYHFEIITTKLSLQWPMYCELGLILIILILCVLGGVERNLVIAKIRIYSPTPIRSLTYLVLATVLFIVLIASPVFLIGGTIDSSFSNILVTMSGLAVIVSNSWKIRSSIVGLCIILYVLSTFYYFDIVVNKPFGHKALHISAVLLSLGVTVFLSWRGNFLIFDDGPNGSSVPESN